MKLGNSAVKAAMLSTISIASLGLGSVAYAQDEAPQADTTEEAADENVIIVTATKREQTLEEVPISVSVTSGAEIERAQVRDIGDLQTLVPSLRVSQNQSSAATTFIIRGFGNGANNVGIEPAVAVFIDGVYRSRSAAQIGDFPNLRRVEVLRGPQSTLFGKNAVAGVISVITTEPQFEFGGSAELSYGNYNAIVAKANVTGPVSDTLAFGISGNYNTRDGYGTNLTNGDKANERNRWGVRGDILFEPSDTAKFRLIADYDKIDEDCCFVGSVFAAPTPTGAINAIGGRINSNGVFSYGEFTNFPSENLIKNYGVSLQGDIDFGAFALTSISAYRESHSESNADSDFTSADLIGQNRGDIDIETITQELRLASDFDGPFNFLIGGYYFDEKIRNQQALTTGTDFRNYANLLSGGAFVSNEPLIRLLAGIPATAPAFGGAGQGRFEDWNYSNTAWSIFGTADFEITDGLILTGGLNYTKDKKNVASNTVVTDVFSSIDLVQVGAAAGIPGTIPANTFPGQTAALFPRTTACAPGAPAGTCNPFLGLRGFQFQPPFLNLPNAVENGRTRDGKLTYSVRLAWQATDSVNLYASYATGFKATSWNISFDSRPFPADFTRGSSFQVPAPAASPIRTAGLALNNLTTGTRYANPETAVVKEIGIKARWDQTGFNLTFFDQTIKDFQENAFVGSGFVFTNAGKQTTQGIEFDGYVQPVEALRLSLDMTYLDPIYDSYVGSPFGDVSGQQPAGVPELSMTIGGVYTHQFGNSDKLILSADYHYEAPVEINANPTYRRFQREVNALSAALTYEMEMGLQVTLWGRNLTNSKYLTAIFPSVIQGDDVFGAGRGSISGYPSQPRTYGASVKYKF